MTLEMAASRRSKSNFNSLLELLPSRLRRALGVALDARLTSIRWQAAWPICPSARLVGLAGFRSAVC